MDSSNTLWDAQLYAILTINMKTTSRLIKIPRNFSMTLYEEILNDR